MKLNKLLLIAVHVPVALLIAILLSIEPPQRAAGRTAKVGTVWAPAVDFIARDAQAIQDTDNLIKAREKASRAALKRIAVLAERNRQDAAELHRLIAERAAAKAADTLAMLPPADTLAEVEPEVRPTFWRKLKGIFVR